MSAVRRRQVVHQPVVQTQDTGSNLQAKKSALFRRLLLFAIVATLALGVFGYLYLQDREQIARIQEEKETLTKQLTHLQETQADLEQKVELLQDEEYLLTLARTKFFFSQEGETIFSLQED